MSVLVALLSAAAYGVADFCGGTASRRAPALSVLLLSTPVGLACLLLVAPFGPHDLSTAAWAWGAAAGVAGATGVPLLYRGLAVGPMSVVAPLTAVTSAAVPVASGVLLGERPGPLAYVGVVLAVAAVALVSRSTGSVDAESPASPRRGWGLGVALALLAGAAFGAFFVLVDAAPAEAGAWPLVAARATAWVITAAVALAVAQLHMPARPVLGLAIAAGALDGLANALFLVAVRGGLLSLVSVIVALYPASTVLLARAVHSERLARLQTAGLGLAAASVALLAVPV